MNLVQVFSEKFLNTPKAKRNKESAKQIANFSQYSKQSNQNLQEEPMVIFSYKNKKKFKKRYNYIVNLYRKRKIRFEDELKGFAEQIQLNEKFLINMSKQGNANRWKKMQRKTLFFSIMRRFLSDSRTFGVLPKKNTIKTLIVKNPKKKEKPFIIYPSDLIMKLHSGMLVFIMMYMVVFYPLDFAFNLDEKYSFYKVLSLLIFGYFTFDIFIGFFSAYRNKEGIIVDNLKDICKNYLRTWFLLDLIATIPVHLMIPNTNLEYKLILKIPRLVRILNSVFQSRGGPAKQSNSLWHTFSKSLFSSATSFYALKSLFITFLFVHIAACVWISLLNIDHLNWYMK